MFSVLSLTMVFGVKAEAAYSSTTAISVTDEGKVVSDAPVQGAAYAIRLISDTKVESSDKAHTYTLKAGIYYFDDKGKAVPRESYIYLYYDIPEEYRLTNAVVTCFDQIREIN